jgi:hypothetical protein
MTTVHTRLTCRPYSEIGDVGCIRLFQEGAHGRRELLELLQMHLGFDKIYSYWKFLELQPMRLASTYRTTSSSRIRHGNFPGRWWGGWSSVVT